MNVPFVSIPHREGTTTAFTPFVTAIISQTHHFCNIFLKKVGRSPFFKVRFLPILSHFLKIVIWALRSTDFLIPLPQFMKQHSALIILIRLVLFPFNQKSFIIPHFTFHKLSIRHLRSLHGNPAVQLFFIHFQKNLFSRHRQINSCI